MSSPAPGAAISLPSLQGIMRSNDSDMMTVAEAAMVLGVSAPTLRALLAEGQLRGYQIGGERRAIRLRRADLHEFLARCEVTRV